MAASCTKEMEYRAWKKQNGAGESIRTSLLGYGCMRFPTTPEGAIDEPRAEALLNAARDAGVNYFDTAYPYHGGQSEPFVGRVIAKWPRESFYLATKMPLWQCGSLEEAQHIFEEQLRRLGVVVAVYQRPAGHHLTDGKTGSVLGHQPPGRGIGKARHGAEHCPVGQGDLSDLQRGVERFHDTP